jgi:hypothetical protein
MEAPMNDRRHTLVRIRRTLPAVALAMVAASLVLSSLAAAEDPPIVSIGPIGVGGTTVSGSVGPDPDVDVCLGDQHSGADPADPSVIQLNDASCQAGASGGSGAGASGPSASQSGPTSGATGGSASGAGTSTGSGSGSGAAAASSAASVAATDAVGLRIAGIRPFLRNVRTNRNIRLLVTVRDGRGLLVRGAIVSAGRVPGSTTTVTGLHAGFSSKVGVARIVVPVTKAMFGKRLYLKIAARTPKARAVALRSVRLPVLR